MVVPWPMNWGKYKETGHHCLRQNSHNTCGHNCLRGSIRRKASTKPAQNSETGRDQQRPANTRIHFASSLDKCWTQIHQLASQSQTVHLHTQAMSLPLAGENVDGKVGGVGK
jgi:hypothetical protein